MSDDGVEFADVRWDGRPVRIEHRWLNPDRSAAPLLVFLHEGLGSLAMWKDYPQRLCDAAGARGLVYSRPGHGRSTPRAAGEHWGVDRLHRQAFELLPALLERLGVDQPPWLFGHSDGGSIALLYASRRPTAGLVVLAPHIMVEEFGLVSIRQAREAYLHDELKTKLARYHDDPDGVFWGWNEAWLDPAFRSWSIEDELPSIGCPLLAVQGLDDQYGTLEQIRGIARRLPRTELLELPDCGHSAHRDQPDALTARVVAFVAEHAVAA